MTCSLPSDQQRRHRPVPRPPQADRPRARRTRPAPRGTRPHLHQPERSGTATMPAQSSSGSVTHLHGMLPLPPPGHCVIAGSSFPDVRDELLLSPRPNQRAARVITPPTTISKRCTPRSLRARFIIGLAGPGVVVGIPDAPRPPHRSPLPGLVGDHDAGQPVLGEQRRRTQNGGVQPHDREVQSFHWHCASGPSPEPHPACGRAAIARHRCLPGCRRHFRGGRWGGCRAVRSSVAWRLGRRWRSAARSTARS